jgi:xanthine dehydrogenase accessory factor
MSAPSYRVVICGTDIIGRAAARWLKTLDFHVIVIAPAVRGIPHRRVAGAHRVVECPYAQLGRRVALGEKTFLLIVTREEVSDLACLRVGLASEAGFITMVSGRSRWRAFQTRLKAEGYARNDLRRVQCPAGIEIGALTPEEIALSIAAQLVQERARRMIGDSVFRRQPAPSPA